MATTRIFSNPRPQFRKDDGSVNSNGRLYFRTPGAGSTTLKSVYSDAALSIPYTNPVILDANGRAPTIYLNGDYNVQETTSTGAQLWRVDNYQPVAFEGQYNAWSASLTYAVNDIVQYANGKYYVSLQSGNVGQTPSSATTYWSEVFFLTVYNASVSYATSSVVYYDGGLWTAYDGPHSGVTPGTDETKWRLSGDVPPKSGFTGVGFIYFGGGVGAGISYSVTSNVTAATYETIGRSSGDNLWAGLPSIPSTAKALLLTVSVDAMKNTGADERFSVSCFFRKPGETRVFPGAGCKSFGGATAQGNAAADNTTIVPLDADGEFEVYWSTLGTPDNAEITLYYVGYME
jgi:hypothetical protein